MVHRNMPRLPAGIDPACLSSKDRKKTLRGIILRLGQDKGIPRASGGSAPAAAQHRDIDQRGCEHDQAVGHSRYRRKPATEK